MQLHEYLTKKRFCDSQIQAYEICKILEEALGANVLYEIVKIIQLNHDQSAIEIFNG